MGLGTSSRASGRLQNVLLAALALLQLGSFNWSKPNPTAPHCDVGTGSSFKAMESGIIKVGEAQVHTHKTTQSPYFSSTVAGLTLPNYFSGISEMGNQNLAHNYFPGCQNQLHFTPCEHSRQMKFGLQKC